jgi:hypothetical protein
MKGASRLTLAGLEFRLTDAVVLGGLWFLILLAAVFNARLERPAMIIGRNVFCFVLYIGAIALLKRLRNRPLRFLLRTASVQLTFLLIFQTGCDLQLLFFGWQDDRVLAWERAIFGSQPLLWVQKLYSPLLSEWMFFVYVVYVVIYPILGAVIYFRHGEDANEDYLFQLGLVNLACSLGFILFPVNGPLRWEKMRTLLTEPFQAGFFGSVGEFIRARIHTDGGSIPSPHCAVATVMWFMAHKYTKKGFVVLAPVILSLYVSTFYGLYHYVSDMVIGIAAALLLLLAAPSIGRAWDRRAGRSAGGAP